MSNIINTTKVATALTSRSNNNLSGQHVTTSNFMETSVSRCLHLVPNQSISVEHMCFSRLEPMPVPTFGRAEIHHNAFFVPYRTIFPAWNDFINDAPHVFNNGETDIVVVAPNIPSYLLAELFMLNSTLALGEQDYDPDFEVVLNESAVSDNIVAKPYRFTPKGRRWYKILTQLGYKWYWNTTRQYHDTVEDRVSMLPLLSLLKVFKDFYLPSAYANTDRFASALKWLSVDLPESEFSWFADFGSRSLYEIMEVVEFVYYSGDYFTNVFDNPATSNSSFSSDTMSFDDFTVDETYVPSGKVISHSGYTSTAPDTPVIRQVANDHYVSPISQYALTALRSLSDYMKRHQLAGTRALERYMARFGIELPAEKLNRCIKVNSWKQDIQFGDVTSTSDTAGASLGSFAGKGVSYGNGTFDFSTEGEYGCFLVVSTIVPKISYYQGQDRNVKHIFKDDFWTPEFDSLGVQAMSTQEVYVPMDANISDFSNVSSEGDLIFGFVPRYAEYKVGRDLISGDFVLPSMNVGKDSWTLFRDVSGYFSGNLGRPHSLNFLLGDYNQYNRIFYNTEDTSDKFNIVHDFKIKSSFPGKSLYDTYEFESEEYGAKKVTVDVGGVKVN